MVMTEVMEDSLSEEPTVLGTNFIGVGYLNCLPNSMAQTAD